jgi:phospholipid transport system substrate-binding protein
MKKILSLILLCFISFFANADSSQKVEHYVSTLLSNTFAVLNDAQMHIDSKKQKLRDLLKANLDIHRMSLKTLGRLGDTFPSSQLAEFEIVYETYLLNSYCSAVESYHGQKVALKGIRPNAKDNYIVKTVIDDSRGTQINVDYLVQDNNGDFKILDVITENISLLSTQRSDFSGILSNSGLGALIDKLKTKNN